MSVAETAEPTVARLLDEAAATLARAGVEAPRLDARLLLAHAMDTGQERLIARPDMSVSEDLRAAFAGLVRRRSAREPVSRILGTREFYGRAFSLAPSVLDPRPDSETVIAAALALLGPRAGAPLAICDLGTGSGALLVTLLAEMPYATGLGIDIDADAVRVARGNARRHGVGGRASFCVADWDQPLAGGFDAIVANPPYIGTEELAALAPEVRDHDPVRALDGGADGLDGHRAIIRAALHLLNDGGVAVIEVGAGQAGAVRRLVSDAGLRSLAPGASTHDLAGHERVVAGRKA